MTPTQQSLEEQEEEHAARRVARRTVWRLRRKVEDEAEEISFLNIMPMMDMMTILLVFLIKQFSVQQLTLDAAPGLKLPASTSQQSPQPAVNITITESAIVVEGDAVVRVQGGAVDAAWKSQGAAGYAITPVVNALSKHRARLTKLARLQNGAFDGIAIVMADKRTPYRLLAEVLYSAGQAEFNNYRLVTLQASR